MIFITESSVLQGAVASGFCLMSSVSEHGIPSLVLEIIIAECSLSVHLVHFSLSWVPLILFSLYSVLSSALE